MKKKLDVIMGDLLKQDVEVIVNSSSTTLLEGGAVDTAIRKVCGQEIEDECKALHGCPVGQVKVTRAYNITASQIIHTASPIWRGGFFNEEKLLAYSYWNSLKKALELNAKTIAFLSISTGTRNFPLEKAAHIAVETIYRFLEENGQDFEMAYLVCYDPVTYDSYRKAYLLHLNKSA